MTKDRRKVSSSKKGGSKNIIIVGSQGGLFVRVNTESRVKPAGSCDLFESSHYRHFYFNYRCYYTARHSLQNSLDKVTWILAKYCQTRAHARKHTQPLANEISA